MTSVCAVSRATETDLVCLGLSCGVLSLTLNSIAYSIWLVVQAPRLSHDVLRKHTEMNEHYSHHHVLVEQIQALTATHQQLAQQMQALVKIVADQHTAANGRDRQIESRFLFAAAVAVSLVLCILVANVLL